MTAYRDLLVGDIFHAINGRAKYIKDYIRMNGGAFPVYSASLVDAFGFIDSFDYEGTFLTWVMNGYGGRIQEVSGKFSLTRDRGILIPRDDFATPDLTYLRFMMEPAFTAAAVGRRVDGRKNDYTKLYPTSANELTVSVPLDSSGAIDYKKMRSLGAKLQRVEEARRGVLASQDALSKASFPIKLPDDTVSVGLDEAKYFHLSIGERVLRNEHVIGGVPVYSANVLIPFGAVSASNLSNFDKPSILWGIDGIFDWNLVPAGKPFATTDHCGRLQVHHPDLLPEYVYWYLKATRTSYGFDRVYRASLGNMKAEVKVVIPIEKETRTFSVSQQLQMVEKLSSLEKSRADVLTAIAGVVDTRLDVQD